MQKKKEADNEIYKKEQENKIAKNPEPINQTPITQNKQPLTLLADTMYLLYCYIYSYVSGLPQEVTEEQFLTYFSQAGMVHYVNGNYKYKLYKDEKGNIKGDGTITYEYPASATMAVQWFNNQYWGYNQIHVEFAQANYNPLENSVVDNNNNVIGPTITATGFKKGPIESCYGEGIYFYYFNFFK